MIANRLKAYLSGSRRLTLPVQAPYSKLPGPKIGFHIPISDSSHFFRNWTAQLLLLSSDAGLFSVGILVQPRTWFCSPVGDRLLFLARASKASIRTAR